MDGDTLLHAVMLGSLAKNWQLEGPKAVMRTLIDRPQQIVNTTFWLSHRELFA
jgi:hypothetical protein